MRRKREKWKRRIVPLVLSAALSLSTINGYYSPPVYAAELPTGIEQVQEQMEEDDLQEPEVIPEWEEGIFGDRREEIAETRQGEEQTEQDGQEVVRDEQPETEDGVEAVSAMEAETPEEHFEATPDMLQTLTVEDPEDAVVYEDALNWLNYISNEQITDIFGMTKSEVAAYLTEVWSHTDISPDYISRFGMSAYMRAQRVYLPAMRAVLADNGSAYLTHGSMYSGPFGYNTCHFDVTVSGTNTDAYCIDPAATTPPTNTYSYYVHEGGGAGTATYAAASILYQYEYHLDNFKAMWNASMDEAEVPAYDRNRFDMESEQSRYFLVHSLVSNCWHAGEIWDGTTAGAYKITGHQEFKNAFALMYTKLLLADHPSGYQVYFLSPGGSYQNIVFANYTPTGKLAVTKQSGNQSVHNLHSEYYSLEGAVYGVYSSAADANTDSNRKDTLVTDGNGYAVSSELTVGDYYVKEITAPKGYNLDPAVYTVTVTADYIDPPAAASIDTMIFSKVFLKKESADAGVTGGNSSFSLSGAVYQVYTDSSCTTKARAYLLNSEGRAYGEEDAVLTTDGEGNSNTLCMARDLYYVKEVSASPGYLLDPTIFEVDLRNYTSEEPYIIQSREPIGPVPVYVKKESENTSVTDGDSSYSLAGATYQVYKDADCTIKANAVSRDANGNFTGYIDAVLTTDEDGNTNRLEMLRELYYVKETAASPGYQLDTNVYTVDLRTFTGETYVINSTEPFRKPSITLKKVSVDTEATNGNSSYSLAGATYQLYTDANCQTKAQAVIVDSEGMIISYTDAVLTTDGEGNTNTLCVLKGMYYVKETEASPGYELDPNVYMADLRNYESTEPYVIHSREPFTPPVITLKKVSANTEATNGNSSYSLAGAMYQVYTDAECQTEAQAVIVDSEGAVIDYTDAVLVTDEEGNTNTLNMMKGLYYVKETEASPGYQLDPNVYMADLRNYESTEPYTIHSTEPMTSTSITLQKVSSNPEITADNRMYSLAGAIYQVYTNAACTTKAQALVLDAAGNVTGFTDAVLTTDEDGNTNTLNLAKGRYFIKEVAASKGFKLDTDPKMADLRNYTSSEPYVITSTETPVGDPAELVLTKTDSEGISMVKAGASDTVTSFGGATLEGAVYKVAYYDDLYDSASIAGKTPKAVWYIQTLYHNGSGTYRAYFDENHISQDYTSSSFYIFDGAVEFPLGTVTYEEIKAASGYKNLSEGGVMTNAGGVADNNVTIMQIRQNGEQASAYVEDKTTGLYTTNADGTRIHVYTTAQDGSDILVQEEIKRADLAFQKINYETRLPMKDVFFRITSSTGESHIIKTNADGYFTSDGNELSHMTNTNGYDAVYNAEDDSAALALGECGVWFFGTEDQAEWNAALVSDDKGAFRYDETYILEELPCSANRGMQKLAPVTLTLTRDNHLIWAGVMTNVPAPQIQTMEWDEFFGEGDHTSIAGNISSIHDTISYRYLTAGKTYTFKTILMELDADGSLKGALRDANGELIRANTVVTMPAEYLQSPQEIIGTVDVKLDVVSQKDAESMAGKRFVIFEYLYEGENHTLITLDTAGKPVVGNAVAVHADHTDENQTGHFADMHTKILQNNSQEEFAVISSQMKLGDLVTYSGLDTEKEYRLYSELKIVDADGNVTGDVLDADGNAVTAVKYFIPDHADGNVTVDFPEFDGYQLVKNDKPSGDIVAFETLFFGRKTLIEHKNPKDEDQTLRVTSLHTTAVDSDTEDHISYADSTVMIQDAVEYYGLIPGKTYTITGVLMNQETGTPVLVDGKQVTATDTFQASERDGKRTLAFTFDGRTLAGTKTVVFEDLYYNNGKLASHADLNDTEQTVEIPKIGTKLTDGRGKKTLVSDGTIALVDEVSYTHLIAGKSYTLSGTLMNKETGKAVMAGGRAVTAETVFTAEKSSGTVKLPFIFELSKSDLLADDGHCPDVVAYETVSYNRVPVAVHAEISDRNQTITIISSTDVKLHKVDEAGTKLIGAGFRLYRQYEVYGDYVTDEEGEITVQDLPYGRYYFVETAAPEGYVADDKTKYSFTVDGESPEVIELTAENEKVRGRITLYKTGDQVVSATEYETVYGTFKRLTFAQKPLEGIVFELYSAEDDSLVETLTTDADGYAVSSLLDMGEYYLVEVKSKNGLINDKKPIPVVLECPENYHEAVYETDITVENAVGDTEINVYKQGEILNIEDKTYSFGKKPLEGVIFGVYAAEPVLDYEGNTVIQADECIGFIRTGADGKAALKDALVEGTYYYKEVQTLEGYILDETKHEFSLVLGNEALNTMDVNKENPDVNQLYKTKLTITKKDRQNGATISGVEFALYNENDECMGIYTTDENGRIIIDELPYGRYYFTEQKAADGYILDEAKHEFIAEAEAASMELTNKRIESPKTGDRTKVGIVFMLAILSFFFGIVMSGFRKTRKEGKRHE